MNQDRGAVDGGHVVDGDDPRVPQAGGRPGLPAEPLDGLGRVDQHGQVVEQRPLALRRAAALERVEQRALARPRATGHDEEAAGSVVLHAGRRSQLTHAQPAGPRAA